MGNLELPLQPVGRVHREPIDGERQDIVSPVAKLFGGRIEDGAFS